jgi:hypothetical protein
MVVNFEKRVGSEKICISHKRIKYFGRLWSTHEKLHGL